MGVFDDREKAQENKYFHEEEERFKARARRNRLFGLWAAALMGLGGAQAEAYADAVVKADFQEPGDGDVLAKVAGDLEAKGKAVGESELKSRLQACLSEALKQIAAEGG